MGKRRKREPTFGDVASDGVRWLADGIGALGSTIKAASQRQKRRRSQAAYEKGQREHQEYLQRVELSSTQSYPQYPPQQRFQPSVPGERSPSDLGSLIATIQEFQPATKHSYELPYQTALHSWLEAKGWSVGYEERKGHSRPDMVVSGKYAIEVKGPTTSGQLNTIASKLLRYGLQWEYVICVLFDIQCTEGYYEEWRRGVSENHPQTVVIRK